jgi:hypothetical protein
MFETVQLYEINALCKCKVRREINICDMDTVTLKWQNGVRTPYEWIYKFCTEQVLQVLLTECRRNRTASLLLGPRSKKLDLTAIGSNYTRFYVDNIKTDFREEWRRLHGLHSAYGAARGSHEGSTELFHELSWNIAKFLSNCSTGRFSRRARIQ